MKPNPSHRGDPLFLADLLRLWGVKVVEMPGWKQWGNGDFELGYIDEHLKDNKMHYIMLDEIQYVSEFEDVLNSYLKISNADVYVTGSNSRFLSSDVITTFRGRGDEIRIAPLSFRDFMTVFEGSREKGLETYLTFGGMPKLATIADDSKKRAYLKGLFENT